MTWCCKPSSLPADIRVTDPDIMQESGIFICECAAETDDEWCIMTQNKAHIVRKAARMTGSLLLEPPSADPHARWCE